MFSDILDVDGEVTSHHLSCLFRVESVFFISDSLGPSAFSCLRVCCLSISAVTVERTRFCDVSLNFEFLGVYR